MQSKDLRIGNYIQNINSKKIERVSSINDLGDIKFRETESGMKVILFANIKEYEYISVNEHILLKLGFEKRADFDVYTNIWELKGFMVSLGDYVNIHVDWADEVGHGYHSIRCYEELFLHDLQNLYFALVGKELELKSESKP